MIIDPPAPSLMISGPVCWLVALQIGVFTVGSVDHCACAANDASAEMSNNKCFMVFLLKVY